MSVMFYPSLWYYNNTTTTYKPSIVKKVLLYGAHYCHHPSYTYYVIEIYRNLYYIFNYQAVFHFASIEIWYMYNTSKNSVKIDLSDSMLFPDDKQANRKPNVFFHVRCNNIIVCIRLKITAYTILILWIDVTYTQHEQKINIIYYKRIVYKYSKRANFPKLSGKQCFFDMLFGRKCRHVSTNF